MYYMIDNDNNIFEGKTITEVCNKTQEAGYFGEGFDYSLKQNEIPVFKGTRIKVKRTDPVYEEVKPAVVKKPVAKKTGAKR